MASKNQILYVVYNYETKTTIAEFLNKDCAIRFCGNYFLRTAAHEYGKFLLTENPANLNDNDLYYYAKVYLDSLYDSVTIMRKIFDDAAQGYIEFDDEYSVNMREVIDRSELAQVMCNKAKEIIRGTNKK